MLQNRPVAGDPQQFYPPLPLRLKNSSGQGLQQESRQGSNRHGVQRQQQMDCKCSRVLAAGHHECVRPSISDFHPLSLPLILASSGSQANESYSIR